MLALNMLISNFTINSIVSLFRAGKQDGAIVLGQRASDKALVVADVTQEQIDSPEPITTLYNHTIFEWGPEDTDLSSRAAENAGAAFGERTGIFAITNHVRDAEASEKAKSLAKGALDKVRAAAEGKTYDLVFTEYDDKLSPEQINVLLSGENEWDHDEFSGIEENESDQRYDGAIREIKDILDEDEFAALDAEQDLLDEARFVIEEHDDSNIVQGLLESTGSLLVRYDLHVDVDVDYTSTDQDRREAALEILAGLGISNASEQLDTTTEDELPHLWSESGARCTRCDEVGAGPGNGPCVGHPDLTTIVPNEALIASIIAILVESGPGAAYMFWYADPAELVKAARPFQDARFGPDDKAPAATITFKDTELLVLNKFAGAGYSEKLPGAFTIPFDSTRLVTDEGDSGYGWNDVAGLVATAFAADVTITAVEGQNK